MSLIVLFVLKKRFSFCLHCFEIKWSGERRYILSTGEEKKGTLKSGFFFVLVLYKLDRRRGKGGGAQGED